jgi:hypothetical protein
MKVVGIFLWPFGLFSFNDYRVCIEMHCKTNQLLGTGNLNKSYEWWGGVFWD